MFGLNALSGMVGSMPQSQAPTRNSSGWSQRNELPEQLQSRQPQMATRFGMPMAFGGPFGGIARMFQNALARPYMGYGQQQMGYGQQQQYYPQRSSIASQMFGGRSYAQPQPTQAPGGN